jgi:CHAT domain-containing protein/predicted negative regulator of RcsB-dependent stress response
VKIVFVLVFFLGMLVFSREKQVDEDKNKKLREEILTVYQSLGEQGLLDFVKKKKDKISNTFIIDCAKAGVKERKEEWLKVCAIFAKEKNDEKTMADVLYQTGEYFRLISENEKASHYFEKAFPIYLKLNDLVGMGNVYLQKGIIYYYAGENASASEMYKKALPFFVKANDYIGQGNVFLNKGNIYLRTSDYSNTLKLLEKALIFFEKAGDLRGQGIAYDKKGSVYLYTGESSNAIQMFNKAIDLFEKGNEIIGQGNVYNKMGLVYSYTGDFPDALEMFDKALDIFNEAGVLRGQGNVYLSKGNIYLRTGKYSSALEMYDKALPLFEKTKTLLSQANLYRKEGEIYYLIGENSKALEMYDKALPIFEKIEEPLGQGNVYLGKGDIYSIIGNNLKALIMYDKALFFYKKAKASIGQGNVYYCRGDIFLKIGDFHSALRMYDRALPFFEKIKDPIGQGNIYFQKGEVYKRINSNSKALEMYDKALPFYIKVGNPLNLGNVYIGKGDIFFSVGEYSKALDIYSKAANSYRTAKTPLNQGHVYMSMGRTYLKIGENSLALEMYNNALALFSRLGNTESEARALHQKANFLVKQGKKDEALNLFENGIAKLEKVRTQTAFSEMKRTFMEKIYNQYEETVLFMLENNYHEKGFKYAESMRARVFLDQMSEGLVRLDKGLTPDLKEKQDKMVAILSLLNKQMNKTAEGKDEKKLQRLKEQYRKTESEFENLLLKIRMSNPLYASVRYPQPVSVRGLQKDVLKEGEILLKYFVTPDKLYVFLISQENFKVITQKIKGNEIKSIIGSYLQAIGENNSKGIKRFGETLYSKLFKPLEAVIKDSKDIIIIPDGELARLPFESLIVDKDKSGRPVFLLEKYSIRYIQSASILSVLRKHYPRHRETKRFIGFGDPVYDYENFKQGKPEQGTFSPASQKTDEIKELNRNRYARGGGVLPRLQKSGEEVKVIADLFEKKSQKSAVYDREKATEDNAKAADMKNFDFIHFACHGLLNEDFQSLVLSQDIPGSKDDGYFTLNEVMNCDYNAKLVVLSACQTGSGKVERAEGVIGLTRAVMYAGTPAVVASLWKVDDTATKELMIGFYKNMLGKNPDKAEALRQAKLEMIKNKKYSSPLFWSAFVMYGE